MHQNITGDRVPISHFIPNPKTPDDAGLPRELLEVFRGDGTSEYVPRPTPYKKRDEAGEMPVVLRARDLAKANSVTIPRLVDPWLPHCGLAALVGKADAGKSMFARQLAIVVVA